MLISSLGRIRLCISPNTIELLTFNEKNKMNNERLTTY
jgi:hypothetical protein